MFPIDVDSFGRPIDAAWAASRDRNERLTEIKQIKGQSETHPLLSPNDEFANYEVLSWLLGGPEGRIPHIFGSYVRQAYKDGLTMQDTAGYNPYKVGVVGASDSHNTGVPYRQDNFFGGHAAMDGNIKERMSGHLFAGLDSHILISHLTNGDLLDTDRAKIDPHRPGLVSDQKRRAPFARTSSALPALVRMRLPVVPERLFVPRHWVCRINRPMAAIQLPATRNLRL